MLDRDYFTVETTSLTLRSRSSLAIYVGDKPRKNPDDSTSHSLRGPLLLMPKNMWNDDRALIEKVAKLLNENAHLFFDSAKPQDEVPHVS